MAKFQITKFCTDTTHIDKNQNYKHLRLVTVLLDCCFENDQDLIELYTLKLT